MQLIAVPLSTEEKRFLYDQRLSEHWRCFDKAIMYLYGVEAAMLVNADREQLPVIQGRMQGLLLAKHLLVQGLPPDPEKPTERISAHRGKKF